MQSRERYDVHARGRFCVGVGGLTPQQIRLAHAKTRNNRGRANGFEDSWYLAPRSGVGFETEEFLVWARRRRHRRVERSVGSEQQGISERCAVRRVIGAWNWGQRHVRPREA